MDIIGNVFKQNCGDSLKVLSSCGDGTYICEFLKYPYKVKRNKTKIIKGLILNPQIEKEEFIGKEFFQNCGDFLKVIRKTSEKNSCLQYYYEVEFLGKYGCKRKALKQSILKGKVDNLGLPWKSRENLLKYCKEVFGNYIPTIKELEGALLKDFKDPPKSMNNITLKLGVRDNFQYWKGEQQEEVSNYIKSIYKGIVIDGDNKILEGKEIDILLPELKLGIEYNGDYWHSDDVIRKKFNLKYKSAADYHKEKYDKANLKGIKLYFIWEHDWVNRNDVVKRYLKILINYYEKIYFNN